MARSAAAPRQRAALVLSFMAAAWYLAAGPTFCGGSLAPSARSLDSVPCNGWRLDMMEVGPKGIGQLVIHEGYFIGEKAMFEIMAKNGYRYRMRATKEEMEKGIDVPPITQIGPLKLRLYESFGGSCRKPGLKRPAGYRGCAGAAGWDTDIIQKGDGFALSKERRVLRRARSRSAMQYHAVPFCAVLCRAFLRSCVLSPMCGSLPLGPRICVPEEEMEKGIDVPPITQIGPLKLRLYESFGGSCRKPGLKRPAGYRGCAGAAGWDTDIIQKGDGFALSK
eukprot:CAMPEP_0204611068 /NCGR_PEP_ID=MMETSP0661-20131031/61834_1 /ASSEMBLY_ACC=CAM_ASM_000606 /TAXON_ID=109239 /ORGANISM="Alexandrium margalefi, Strain AMGDE01CS-322" /LENGTH=278 /DNA_ID=CAMNT_0051622907 /DNA_START=74 /DNA_END=911 /DNA_ORIENTATION=-